MNDPVADRARIEPFDRRARRTARDRAAGRFSNFDFLKRDIAEELAARAATFERKWGRVLDLGAHDGLV
ncbi:MAG: SAM-dependent methyltransferase, partial [Pacificimonas sp.]